VSIAPPDERQRPPDPEERSRPPLWRELSVLLVLALAIALVIKTFVAQAFFIPSESMLPTLKVGDRVIVEKIGYRIGDPARGDIVVFEREADPQAPEPGLWTRVGDSFRELFGLPVAGREDLIKRVIAVEGDRIEARDGTVFVNGRRIDEPYLSDDTVTSDFSVTTVPPDTVWVMGDNRAGSGDSRGFGPVHLDEIVGEAVFIVWPLSDLGAI
jgi:signal peptidase I